MKYLGKNSLRTFIDALAKWNVITGADQRYTS